MKKLIWLLGLSMLTCVAFGQEKPVEYKDVVYMENGSVFKARILTYEQGGEVRLEIQGGHQLVVQESEIKRIVQISDLQTAEPEPVPREPLLDKKLYPVKGWSFGLGAVIAPGLSAVDDFSMMLGIDAVASYSVNQWLGLGVGAGYDRYNLSRGERIFPVFAEWRIMPFKGNLKPYLRLAGGYGFAFKNLNRDVVEAKGGYMVNPAIGMRFYTGKESDLFTYIDFGIRMQEASFTWENPDFTFADSARRDITYQRWALRFGFRFWSGKSYLK